MNPYPEEINRKLIGQLASFHFAPTSYAADKLAAEGISGPQVFISGNTVVDALYSMLQTAAGSRDGAVADRYFDSKAAGHHAGHILVTAHRRESWGEPLDNLALGIKDAAMRLPDHLFFVPLHPNPIVRRSFHDLPPNVILGDPLPYPVFLRAMETADVIVTDSGGVLEEATALGKRVIIVREETERPEAIAAGAATLVGLDPTRVTTAVCAALEASRTGTTLNVFGDGHAAERITGWLRWHFGHASMVPEPFIAGADHSHPVRQEATESTGAWL
jgi:UDP-N-acetylglucosamine 2-epimerase (non-hydrolysing)